MDGQLGCGNTIHCCYVIEHIGVELSAKHWLARASGWAGGSQAESLRHVSMCVQSC